tara:strand:- start:715 stop:1527 length:813 start_codon:yes stop_codon:yes gene_type:complete
MSNSALSSAKRRRANQANIMNSPLLQSQNSGETMTPESSSVSEAQNNRPISLQQALQLLNSRLVKLERLNLATKEDNASIATNSATHELSMEMIIETVAKSSIMEEFNHRYEVLASEILNLKHIVMKLQSYTLDINKTLVEERIQILSDVPTKEGVSLLEVKDDLNLREDIQTMIENTDLKTTLENDETLGKDLKMEEQDTSIVQEAVDTKEEEVHAEKEENISMTLEDAEAKEEEEEPIEAKELVEESSKKSRRKKKDEKKTVALDLEN